jgi:hypothetical protein
MRTATDETVHVRYMLRFPRVNRRSDVRATSWSETTRDSVYTASILYIIIKIVLQYFANLLPIIVGPGNGSSLTGSSGLRRLIEQYEECNIQYLGCADFVHVTFGAGDE